MKIPIRNLYYLLSYALSEYYVAGSSRVSGPNADHPLDLLCRVLLNETEALLKHGLHQSYQAATFCDGSIRGRLDFQASLKSGSLAKRQVICHHDELASDSALNRLIKGTLTLVARMDQIDPQLRKTAGRLALRLSEVGRGTFTKADFAIRIDRNLKRYALAIGVCKFLHESTLIDDEGQSRFVDFSRDEVAMRDIFERFVRNLLRHKLGPPYIVSRRKFPFAKLHGSPHDITYVPTMLTDVVVECSSSALVIEVKYVPGATQVYRGVERFRSTHLYQLLSYLGNYPDDKKALSGLLLYPATTRSLSASVVMRDLPVDIAEIDLSLDWFEIEARLLGLVRSIFDRVAVGSLQVAA